MSVTAVTRSLNKSDSDPRHGSMPGARAPTEVAAAAAVGAWGRACLARAKPTCPSRPWGCPVTTPARGGRRRGGQRSLIVFTAGTTGPVVTPTGF